MLETKLKYTFKNKDLLKNTVRDGIKELLETHNTKAEEIDNLVGGQLAVTLYLYPNPTDGLFYVNVPAATEGATVSVTTLSGTQLYSTTLTEGLVAIDLRGQLAAGIYLVTVNSNKQASTSKLIVK